MIILKPKDVTNILKISSSTLRRWDSIGKLKSRRNECNRRYYTQNDIDIFLGKNLEKKNVLYARVSGRQQINDLKNQKDYLMNYSLREKLNNLIYFEDIGSGLNFKRRNFLKLMDMVENEEISSITITYKDRLVRFGYEWFEQFCLKHNVKLNVLNSHDQTPEEELVEDLVSIIHIFSSRIYGIQKYTKREIKDVLDKERNLS